jgi:hypothetical protein
MSLELPVIVIPALIYNMLLCGLAAAIAWHVGNMLERHLKAVRNRD